MNKNEFITLLSEKGYTKIDCGKIIDDVFTTLMDALASGESVQIYGFGTFGVRDSAPKEIVDYQTKERISVPGHKAPKFVPGRLLKMAVREGIVRA